MLVRVLLAAHRSSTLGRLRRLLPARDVLVETARDADEVQGALRRESPDLLLITRGAIPGVDGDFVREVAELPERPVILVLLERDDESDHARLLAAGADGVLSLGTGNPLLRDSFEAFLRRCRARPPAPRTTAGGPRLSAFVSSSPAMKAFLKLVRRVVDRDATLLITGETGVGKEWLARAIHSEGPRREGPFVGVNCGALPESLLESELFGHEEGAFTGASRSRRGIFELAHRGTLFLDEIGEMPVHLQVRLLTVLQSREVQRLGGERRFPVDVRVMAATNRDLDEEVEEGRFRRDLFYRLSVVSLAIPALRERREDIPALVESAIEHFRARFPQAVESVSPAALDALGAYDWPGNVRELINVVERAMLLSEGPEIGLVDLPPGLATPADGATEGAVTPTGALPADWLDEPLNEVQRRIEKSYLEALLRRHRGRVGKTAEAAGIDPRSLYDKMRRHALDKHDYR